MLELRGLGKCFGDRWAVAGIDLRIPSGQMVGVIGRSGAGKSTMLRMINRLIEPSDGSIVFDGAEVSRLRGKALRDWRQRCAMIFQQFNLVGRLDVLTNVLVGRVNHVPSHRSLLRLWPDRDRDIALSALAQLDMAGHAAQRAENLSGGQQQRVAIARALVQEPRILLADEPVASLDPRNSQVVMDAIRRINGQYGITVLVNLHSLDLARSYCDRLIGLAGGRVVFDDAPAMLTEGIARDIYGLESDDVLDRAPSGHATGAAPAFVPA